MVVIIIVNMIIIRIIIQQSSLTARGYDSKDRNMKEVGGRESEEAPG